MRQNFRDFAKIVSQTLPLIEPIYEFGHLQVRGAIGFADLRPLFPGRQHLGCDRRDGPVVDRILDLHEIDLPSETVGTVLSFDTLDHSEYPRKALREIHRMLKPNGIAVISSAMNFEIQDDPYDYWRFGPEGFRPVLEPFSSSFVGYQGIERFPHAMLGIGVKGEALDFSSFERQFTR